MFRNRHLQVRVVRDNDESTKSDTPDTSVADLMYIMHETGKAAVKGAVVLVAAYVVLDTARQVTVNNTDPSKKNNN